MKASRRCFTASTRTGRESRPRRSRLKDLHSSSLFRRSAASYEGALSADGTTIKGTFTQGGPLPLDLVKATPSTQWEIPEPPPPPRMMAADAKPTFEVATIKPSDPAAQGQGINVNPSGHFTMRNTPLVDLIKFTYGLHPKQIVGAPSWVESERFDILAKPDLPGLPARRSSRR